MALSSEATTAENREQLAESLSTDLQIVQAIILNTDSVFHHIIINSPSPLKVQLLMFFVRQVSQT